MSEPTPKRSNATRPAVPEQSGKDKDGLKTNPTVAKRLDAEPAKSSLVISKSYRVVELPPPPVVAPPPVDQADDNDAPRHDRLPDALASLPERERQAPIELDALQIGQSSLPAGRWSLLSRRVRMPARWVAWLADPQRRNSVGVMASIMIHIAIIALLGLVLGLPAGMPQAVGMQAREVLPAGKEMTMPQREFGTALHEPVVQLAAEELETLALDPPEDSLSEISNVKSQTGGYAGSGPATKLDPPRLAANAAAPAPGWEAHPTIEAPSNDPALGMADGSQLTPDLLQAIDRVMQEKFNRRNPAGRGAGVRYGGGTPKSEEAVERALHWLAIHQRADGSWSFNHLNEGCQHYCTHPGSEASLTASTAMALLPFLGAGYTHKQGAYHDAVQHGLDYLKSRGMKISYGTDLRDGSMYGHALATIALCEAYGMTHDADLKEAAQGGLDFIAFVQDNNTGGWRYNPGESGDTTVTGWMIMALKSGQMARLRVPSPAIIAAERFLNSVQNADGSQYGYQSRKPRATTTSVALLCRMYTGWRRDNPALIKGVAYLAAQGPSDNSLYFDYYATQVLFHWNGPEWDVWNRKMREHLISTQDRIGHPSGSWYFDSAQSFAGGRLYNTAMATMILEVYYRFMPLYGEEAVEAKPE